MYNNEVKIKFLEEIKTKPESGYDKNYLTLFDQLAKFEYTNNEDIYDLDYEKLLVEILNISVSASISTLRSKYSLLRRYKRWALINDFISENSKVFVEEKVNIKNIYLNNCNVVLYRNAKELLDKLYSNLKFEGNDTVSMDELIIAFYSLIYQGFTPEEVLEIQISNVSKIGNDIAITIKDKIIIINEAFKDIVLHLYNNRSFISDSPRKRGVFRMSDRLIDTGGELDNKTMRKSITTSVSRRKLTWIKPNEVFIMGSINRAIQQNPWVNIKARSGKNIILNYYLREVDNGSSTSNAIKEHIYRYCEMW